MVGTRRRKCLTLRGVRREQRAKKGPLRRLVLAPRTKVRYEKAAHRYFQYLRRLGEDFAKDEEALDSSVSDFIEELWASGDPRGYASDLLSSLQHHLPELRVWLFDGW